MACPHFCCMVQCFLFRKNVFQIQCTHPRVYPIACAREFVQMCSECHGLLTSTAVRHIVTRIYFCRVEDYWQGYKLFCYAYYARSIRHEAEFRESKLGSLISPSVSVLGVLWLWPPRRRHGFFISFSSCMYPWQTELLELTGCLVWRRHGRLASPSHNAIRTTCTQLLPLVEMFCKWELGEDCSDLRALMLRYDSELELGSHDLGRSLLCTLRNDNVELGGLPRQTELPVRANPFAGLTERLSKAAMAIRDLHAQVQPLSGPCSAFLLVTCRMLSLKVAAT